MNQTYLARAIGQLFRAPEGDGTTTGGGTTTTTTPTQTTTPAQVNPADARTFLKDFGHSDDSLKAMKDEDVVKLHGSVSQRLAKEKTPPGDGKGGAGEIKLELPKDSALTQEDVNAIAEYAKANKLSQEQAKQLLDREHATASRVVERQQKSLAEARVGWMKEVETDKDLGGDNLATTQRVSQLAIDRFLPNTKDAQGNEVVHPLRQFFRATGYGDHPMIVRLFRDIGKAMDEGQGLTGKGGGSGSGKKSAEEVLYGSSQ